MAQVPLLGQNQQPQAQTENTPTFVEAKTAFIVYIKDDGSTGVSTDIDIPLVVERAPTINEIYSAVGIIQKDIQREEAVAQTITMLDMVGRRAMEAQQNALLQQQLGKLK